jgi:hypothetical protein
MSTHAEPVVHYTVDFKFADGKVRIALREDKHGMKITAMRSSPRRRGLGRKALQLLKEKGLVGRPANIMRDADGFWVKMHSEGLVKQPYSLRTRQNRTSQTQLKKILLTDEKSVLASSHVPENCAAPTLSTFP